MKHAREDYNRIQDPAGLIPADEPVFLIRGQDAVGATAVRGWAHLHHVNGGSDTLYESAMRHADAMEAWPKKKRADLSTVSSAVDPGEVSLTKENFENLTQALHLALDIAVLLKQEVEILRSGYLAATVEQQISRSPSSPNAPKL